jgi:acyl-CoA synthetase (AMP-forming)/AMP-acid ligase II
MNTPGNAMTAQMSESLAAAADNRVPSLHDAPSPLTAPEAGAFTPLPMMIAEWARRQPERRALLCEGKAVSWREFGAGVERVAAALLAMGLKHGEKVAVLAPPSLEYIELFFGILRAGGCVVPLSTMAGADQLQGMIEDADSKVFVLASSMRDLAASFADKLKGLLPGGRIALDFSAPGWQSYQAWLAAAPRQAPAVEISPDDPFNLIYSSGTTGVPKGIMHNHALRWFLIQRWAGMGFGPDSVTIVSTPLYSNTTLVSLLPSLAQGGGVVLMKKFDVVKLLQLCQQEKVTHAMLVPVQYQRILNHPDFGKYDLSSFKMKLSTSAPLRYETKKQIVEHWPGGMVEVYGLTEGGGSCLLDVVANPTKLHTVGQPAYGTELKIIDEQGREVRPGEVGELIGRSYTMMSGYYKQPDKTREMLWFDKDGRMFFRSGDLGRMDQDGFVTLLDRKKDMIISGGFNIYAADLEVVLTRHPDVADMAVIGIPSDQWGESPLALVVRRPGAKADEETLKNWANEQLGKTQRIAAVEFRDSLPRSTIGKVLKKELRAPYWEKAGRKI